MTSPDLIEQISRLKAELRQTQLAYQMATQMSQFKAGFLARTAHELRSPLSSLISLHQMVLSDLCDDPAEERECITQAQDKALKLVKLLDALINVSKTQQGTHQLAIQPLQLSEILEEVHNLTHLQIANRGYQLYISSPEPEIYVLADLPCLRQVLVSLVDTATNKMQAGSIQISAQPDSTSEEVKIWIDVESSPEAWSDPVDLLQSAPETDTREQTLSPGMQLLMNQTLLEVMQGRLEIVAASADGNLTRLQVSIPLASPETASLEQAR
jgi:K+-sensing histidine kinase KdpD